MSTRDELVTGVPGAAAFGMMGAMGLGLARTEGAEPWLAGLLAVAMAVPCLSVRVNPKRPAATLQAIAADLRADWAKRAAAYGLIALGLFIPHLALWLVFGMRFWPLGLLVAAACVGRLVATGLVYASETRVPRWSGAPTALLFLVQGATAGLLGLSAIEGLLGFPPGLVAWKAAIGILGLGLMAQWWQQEADAADDLTVPYLRIDPVAERGRREAVWLFRAALGFGLVVPLLMAMVADGQTERVLMPLAFLAHLVGLAAHRLLFFAQARESVAAPEAADSHAPEAP